MGLNLGNSAEQGQYNIDKMGDNRSLQKLKFDSDRINALIKNDKNESDPTKELMDKLMDKYKNFSDEALDNLYNTISKDINKLDSQREWLDTEHHDDELTKIWNQIDDLQTKLYEVWLVLWEKRTAEFVWWNQALENFIGKVYERLDWILPKRELVVAILNDPTWNGKDLIRRLYPEINIDRATRLQDNVKPSFTVRCIEARDTTGDPNHVSLYISSKSKLAEDENQKPVIITFNKKDIGLD